MNKLHKEAKSCLDYLRATCLVQQKLSEHVHSFYSDQDENYYGAVKFKDAMEALIEHCQAVDSIYRDTVLNPLTKFVNFFPDINQQISKRSKKLLDYDQARTRTRKLIEKPSDDPGKLPRSEAECQERREVYEAIHNKLLTDLPQLCSLRDPYLQPSFEAFVKSQLDYFENFKLLLEQVRPQLYENSVNASSARDVLNEMKALTIVGQ